MVVKPGKPAKPRDTLDPNVLSNQFGFAARVINSNPELLDLFKLAAKEGWEDPKIDAELKSTDWFKNNNEYAREAWTAEQKGGADWETIKQTAFMDIQKAVVASGSTIDPQSLVHQYLYEGWNKPGREQLLKNALTPGLDKGKGWTATFGQNLKNAAYKAGVSYADDWYMSAAKSVSSGLTSADTWLNDISERSAGLYPVYAEKIRAGVSVRDLASPYLNQMADIFDISPDQISIDDPYIAQAMGGVGTDGVPKATNLWDFQQKLKKDPRWMETNKAGDSMSRTSNRILQMFGIEG